MLYRCFYILAICLPLLIEGYEAEIFFKDGASLRGEIPEIPPLIYPFGKIQLPAEKVATITPMNEGRLEIETNNGDLFTAPRKEGAFSFTLGEANRNIEWDEVKVIYLQKKQPGFQRRPHYQLTLEGGLTLPVKLAAAEMHFSNGWEEFKISPQSLENFSYDGSLHGSGVDRTGLVRNLTASFAKDPYLFVQVKYFPYLIKFPWDQISSLGSSSPGHGQLAIKKGASLPIISNQKIVQNVVESYPDFFMPLDPEPFYGSRDRRPSLLLEPYHAKWEQMPQDLTYPSEPRHLEIEGNTPFEIDLTEFELRELRLAPSFRSDRLFDAGDLDALPEFHLELLPRDVPEVEASKAVSKSTPEVVAKGNREEPSGAPSHMILEVAPNRDNQEVSKEASKRTLKVVGNGAGQERSKVDSKKTLEVVAKLTPDEPPVEDTVMSPEVTLIRRGEEPQSKFYEKVTEEIQDKVIADQFEDQKVNSHQASSNSSPIELSEAVIEVTLDAVSKDHRKKITDDFLKTNSDLPSDSKPKKELEVLREVVIASDHPASLSGVPHMKRTEGRVYIPPKGSEGRGFYISPRKVSNQEYSIFVDETGHKAPTHWNRGRIPEGEEFAPVVNITYKDALVYSVWTRQRLPSASEWQRAFAEKEALEDIDDAIYEWTSSPTVGKKNPQRPVAEIGAKKGSVKRIVLSPNDPEAGALSNHDHNCRTGFRCASDSP